MSLKGYPSQEKDANIASQHVTVEPVRNRQHALSTIAHSTVRQVATDAVEASSTVRVINATAHAALPGDVICFTSGACDGEEAKVFSVETNSITLVEDLSVAPSAADAFEIMRHKYSRVDADGNLQTTAGALQIKVDGADTFVNKDTAVPANTVPIPVEIVAAGSGVEINVTTGDIGIQTSHTGANPDSMQVGDGTNLLVLNSDGSVTAQPGFLSVTGSASSLTNIIPATDVSRYGSAIVQISGTWSGSWVVEGSLNGTDYVAIPIVNTTVNTTIHSSSNQASTGIYRIPLGFALVRVRAATYTSGTIVGHLIAISEAQNGTYRSYTTLMDNGGTATALGYGSVSNGLRVAAIPGNASGIADFGAGNASAQTPRVVLASDQALTLPAGAATSALQTTGNTSLSSIDGKLTTETNNTGGILTQVTSNGTALGAINETAPVSDTASSGLNGRLQRIAQRLTSLIAQIPAALGQTTMAGSLSVTVASNQSAIPVTVSAPAAGTITVDDVAVGLTAVRLTVSGSAPNAARKRLRFQPDSTSAARFFYGPSGVTTSTGIEIFPAQSEEMLNDASDYYIISDAASQVVRVLEVV